MPQGKGTYGSKRGRPPKKSKVQYKTTKKSMSKKDAKKAINSKGMRYPNTKANRSMISNSIDDFLLTLRDTKGKPTRKGRKAIKKASKKKGGY